MPDSKTDWKSPYEWGTWHIYQEKLVQAEENLKGKTTKMPAHKTFKECKAEINVFLKENKPINGLTMCGIYIPTQGTSWVGWINGGLDTVNWIKTKNPTEYYIFDLKGEVLYAPFILEPGLGDEGKGYYSDINDVMETVKKNITKWAKYGNKIGRVTLGKNDQYIAYDKWCSLETVKKWITDLLNKPTKEEAYPPKTSTEIAMETANKVFGWPQCPTCGTTLYKCINNCHYTNSEENGFEKQDECHKKGQWVCKKCQIHTSESVLKVTQPTTTLSLVEEPHSSGAEKPQKKGEPMARNFWVEIEVDGKKVGFKSGPKSANGGFSMKVFQRDNGSKVQVLDVSGTSNGKQTTLATQVTSENQPIFKIKTKR